MLYDFILSFDFSLVVNFCQFGFLFPVIFFFTLFPFSHLSAIIDKLNIECHLRDRWRTIGQGFLRQFLY